MRRLAWTCGGFCAAIFLAHYVLPGAWLALLTGVCAAGAVVLIFARKQTLRRAVLCLVGAAVGFAWYAAALRELAPLDDIPWEEQTVTARVTEYPKVYDDAASLTVKITSPELRGLTARLSDYTRSVVDLRPGDEISALVKLRSGALRYGEASDAYLSQGVELAGYLRAEPEKTGVWRWHFLYAPKELSHALLTRAAALFPQDAASFATALMLGEKQALYAENLDIPMKNAGIMHAVAVSGMHLAFLLGFFRLVGGKGKRAALLTVPALALFAVMAGCTPSVLRAAVMTALFLLAPVFERENDPPTALFAALAVLLAANPFSAGSVSLQLSFASLAGILLVGGRLNESLRARMPLPKGRARRPVRALRDYLAATLATTFGAMLFTVPLSAIHFGTVTLAAPVTNLLVLWLLPAAFLGCYAAVALSFCVPVLGRAAAWCVAWLLRYVLCVARGLGGIRALRLSAEDPRVVLWLALTYAVFFLAWRCKRAKRWRYAAAALCSVMVLVIGLSVTRIQSRSTPRLAALDVGQGQCLVFCAGDETIMVDCGGGATEQNAGDIAAQYLCTEARGGVDTLFLTHPHEDHVNGVCRLLLQAPVKRIVLPAAADPEGREHAAILALAEQQGVEVVRVDADTALTLADLQVCLYAELGREHEGGCMLLRVSYGDFDTLITGDVTTAVEKELIGAAPLADTEVFIVGHHGSKYASGDALLDALDAEIAIISCGYNSYGHPTEETLSRLRAHEMTIYRTDQDGTVTVRME